MWGVFLVVSHAPIARGRCPSASQFWSSLLFMHTAFDAEIWRGNYRGCMLGSATPPIPREQSSSAPKFGDSLSLCLHPLTQNDQFFTCIFIIWPLLLCGHRSAAEPTSPAECRPQHSSMFPRSIRSHAHRCSCLTR